MGVEFVAEGVGLGSRGEAVDSLPVLGGPGEEVGDGFFVAVGGRGGGQAVSPVLWAKT